MYELKRGVQPDTIQEDKIHGVNLKSYNTSGQVTYATYIPGETLHDNVYSIKTREFMSLEDYKEVKVKRRYYS